MKIGFIGLGIMGRPMALNLKNGGHDLIVPERASLTAEIRAAAEVVGPHGKTVAEKSEVVIIMVPDTPDVESVLFGAGGVAEGLKKGTLVIEIADAKDHELLWRGSAMDTISDNSSKNINNLNKAVSKMFSYYPPKDQQKK